MVKWQKMLSWLIGAVACRQLKSCEQALLFSYSPIYEILPHNLEAILHNLVIMGNVGGIVAWLHANNT